MVFLCKRVCDQELTILIAGSDRVLQGDQCPELSRLGFSPSYNSVQTSSLPQPSLPGRNEGVDPLNQCNS